MADKKLTTIAGDTGIPRLISLTKTPTQGFTSGVGPVIASLAAGQALQTVLEITTPISIGYLSIDADGSSNVVDRVIITSELGVLYDGDATSSANGSSWFIGASTLTSDSSLLGYQATTQQFIMDSLKIELETTSTGATVEIFSDLELIQ